MTLVKKFILKQIIDINENMIKTVRVMPEYYRESTPTPNE